MGKLSRILFRPFIQASQSRNSPVRFYNFWDYENINDLWFYRFIRHRGILEKAKLKRIDFYSVFGPRFLFGRFPGKSDLIIFYSGENVENFPAYLDHLISKADLSIGFEFIPKPNYFRFPLWIMYIVKPEWGYVDIKYYIEQKLNFPKHESGRKFCCLVASHDRNGIRQKIMNEVSRYGPVDSGGKIYNNTKALLDENQNDKATFLRQYFLNICPENSDKPGYVTEKLFQSLENGCIPLYWGSGNQPEADILEQEAIWFYDPSNPEPFREKIAAFQSNQSIYKSWCGMPKFKEEAAFVIYEYLNRLEQAILKHPSF